jgi:hypothetical protein
MQGPNQGGVHVVVLVLEAAEPLLVPFAPRVWLSLLKQRATPSHVLAAQPAFVILGAEQVDRVHAHRLEHEEARLPVAPDTLLNEAMVQERRELVQQVISDWLGTRRRSSQATCSGEHRLAEPDRMRRFRPQDEESIPKATIRPTVAPQPASITSSTTRLCRPRRSTPPR